MTCPDDYAVVMRGDLPGDVLAVVRVDANGYPTVYINDCLSLPAKRMALRHELWHFANGDFDNHVTIYDAEKKACHAAKMELFPRAFRPLTEEKLLKLDIAGAAMFCHCFGDPTFDLPLEMPEPMYEREPQSPVHGLNWLEGW